MSDSFDKHPVRTQWIATLGAIAISAFLVWVMEPHPLSRWYEVALTGIVVYLVFGYMRRKRRARGQQS